MAAPAMQAIANITLNTAASSVVFSNIPQIYRDLKLVVNSVSSAAAESYSYTYFNGDSGANYSRIEASGNGSTTGTSTSSNLIPITMPSSTSGTFGNAQINIVDYSASDRHKTVLYQNDTLNNTVVIGAGRWASTSAITSISITAYSNSFGIGSTFTLHGVLA